MNNIERIFASIRSHFEKQGKLKIFRPLYDAIETVFLWPDTITEKSPHIRDNLDLKRFMSLVLVALIPPLLFGIYNTGYESCLASGLSTDFFTAFLKGLSIFLPVLLVSYGVGLFWEVLFAIIRKHPVSEGFLVTGLLFPMTLPSTIPLWQVAVGISFGVVIGKEVFGGTGRNILNPALTGRAFIFFAYPAKMSGDIWTKILTESQKAVDGFSGATPLAIASMADKTSVEQALTHAGYSFSKLFMGTYPGSMGGTSALMCLMGGIFLVMTGIANYRTIAGGIAGILATGWLFNIFAGPGSPPWFFVNPFYHLVMGGFAFGIIYMATDPVSSPGMESVKYIYGFLIGFLTIIIRVLNPAYPEGVMLAILFMNIFAPLLDHFEIKIRNMGRIPNV